VVASERTDGAVPGNVQLVVPPGWDATPPGRLYRLAPGAHLEFDASITPGNGTATGRYFIAARFADEGEQLHEDVLTVDYEPVGQATSPDRVAGDGRAPAAETASLAAALARAMRTAGIDTESNGSAPAPTDVAIGGEIEVELLTGPVELRAGDVGSIQVRLRNLARSEIRGEAQLVSPHETWPALRPWAQGFAVRPGEDATVSFEVAPPYATGPGTYWALVKVMYFGRLHYTESVSVHIESPSPIAEAATEPVGAAAAGAPRATT
jgi:hypothetical protein